MISLVLSPPFSAKENERWTVIWNLILNDYFFVKDIVKTNISFKFDSYENLPFHARGLYHIETIM